MYHFIVELCVWLSVLENILYFTSSYFSLFLFSLLNTSGSIIPFSVIISKIYIFLGVRFRHLEVWALTGKIKKKTNTIFKQGTSVCIVWKVLAWKILILLVVELLYSFRDNIVNEPKTLSEHCRVGHNYFKFIYNMVYLIISKRCGSK